MKAQARGRLIVAPLVVVLGALLVTASASAAWTPYINVSKQENVEQPIVEMDPAGDTVFLWMQGVESAPHPSIYTRVRAADGALSPIQRISGEFGGYDLAVDSQGNAYYVWTDLDSSGAEHLRTRVRFTDGTLSPVQTLKNVGSGDFVSGTVGVSGSGFAVYAWTVQTDDGSTIQARSRPSSGVLSPIHTVAHVPPGSHPEIGVDSAGDATLVWEGSAPDHIAEFTRVLAADGTLSPVVRVSRKGYPSAGSGGTGSGEVGVTPTGRAVFAWGEYDEAAKQVDLMVRARSPGGQFSPPQILARPNAHQETQDVQLAVADTGEAALSWRSNDALHARTLASGGTLGPTKTIASVLVDRSDLGIDSQGHTVFAWEVPDGAKRRVFVRSEDTDGALSAARALSLAGYNAYFPDVAVTPAGDAAVGWQEGNAGFAIQASFGP